MVGYDKHSLNHQLVLDITMEEETGLVAYCRGQTDIVMTLNGVPNWLQFINGLQYMDFDPTNPDWLDAPQADTGGLDFTAGNFSMMVWARIDVLADRYLMVRGLADTDGWMFMVGNTGRLGFATCQTVPAATQSTFSFVDIEVATWYLLGMSRNGENVRLYINGQDRTDAPDTHIDPLTSPRELHIGILDDETNSPWDGGMHRPRAWSRWLEPWEHRQAYLMSAQLFP